MDTDTTVRRRSGPERFEISVDGRVAGFTRFVDVDAQRIFVHTEIGEEFGGRGLAGAVVREALDATRTDGLRVVPVCPFVASYVASHTDWSDLVDPVTREALRAVPRA